MRVKAIQRGYYGSKIREPGEEFSLRNEKDFSKKWMAETDASKQAKAEAEKAAKAEADAAAKADAKAKAEAEKAAKSGK